MSLPRNDHAAADAAILLEGVCNFRDFGGVRVAGGGRVAKGRLFRSANLSAATPADAERLAAIGVAVLADLRHVRERDLEPNAWPDRAATPAVKVIESALDETVELPPHLDILRRGGSLTAEQVRAYMCGVYAEIPYKERYVGLFRDVFHALRDGDGGVLVHCAAGKDRTGILCGLILDTLGAAHEDVVADYELSNAEAALSEIARQAAARIGKRIGRPVDMKDARLIARVERGYLDAAWEGMRARSGTLAGYRRDVLGVTERDEADIKARLVAS